MTPNLPIDVEKPLICFPNVLEIWYSVYRLCMIKNCIRILKLFKLIYNKKKYYFENLYFWKTYVLNFRYYKQFVSINLP